MSTKPILIYGAYGYSGRLALEHAVSLGLDVIAGGRDQAQTREVAQTFGTPFQVFSVDDRAALRHALEQCSVILNCAGPFVYTAEPIVRECLDLGVHYLDITGELDVIESLAQKDESAKKAGVTLLPAAGFDVVPTDCMAAYLKQKLPDATHLDLAFHASGGLSHGTAQTMVESLGAPSASRKDGKIVEEPLGARTMDVPFGPKTRRVISIPWGDVASAYYTTGIPNVRTYTTVSPRAAAVVSKTQALHGLLGVKPLRKVAKRLVNARITGPDSATRERGYAIVWGRATNAQGTTVEANLTTIETYTLTYRTSVDLARRAQAGELPTGYQTPAGALGADYVLMLENTAFQDLSSTSS